MCIRRDMMLLIRSCRTNTSVAVLNQSVSQGTVLPPLLFNLYVNDLCTAIVSIITTIQFDHDCLVFAYNNDEKIAKKSLESNINNLANYLRELHLKLNSSKTDFFVSANKMIKETETRTQYS